MNKPTKPTKKAVSDFLTLWGIENEIKGSWVWVNRDSICSAITDSTDQSEQGCYDGLILLLKKEFDNRFFFVGKNDTVLALDIMDGEPWDN